MLGSRIVVSMLVKILGRRIFVTMFVKMFGDPGDNLGKDLGWGNLGYILGKNRGLVMPSQPLFDAAFHLTKKDTQVSCG